MNLFCTKKLFLLILDYMKEFNKSHMKVLDLIFPAPAGSGNYAMTFWTVTDILCGSKHHMPSAVAVWFCPETDRAHEEATYVSDSQTDNMISASSPLLVSHVLYGNPGSLWWVLKINSLTYLPKSSLKYIQPIASFRCPNLYMYIYTTFVNLFDLSNHLY